MRGTTEMRKRPAKGGSSHSWDVTTVWGRKDFGRLNMTIRKSRRGISSGIGLARMEKAKGKGKPENNLVATGKASCALG